MHLLHVVIRGSVQGVGFRYFVSRQARTLGLTGWVRNRADGAVEAEAGGEKAALESFVEALRRGPPGARVTEVEVDWSETAMQHAGFDIRG